MSLVVSKRGAFAEDDALELCATLVQRVTAYPMGIELFIRRGSRSARRLQSAAIYKPRAGEAPLYDFPEGTLYLRELAAYLFSRWADGISFRQLSSVTASRCG